MKQPFEYILEGAPGVEVLINGKKYLYFAGTSYYQLHSHPEVIKAANEATSKYGIGSATTRTITGTTDLIVKLEQTVADFYNSEDAVYLPSGYLVNWAGIQALSNMGVFDRIYFDEGSHYCNIEAIKMSGKPMVSFQHRNVEHLIDKIKDSLLPNEKPLIVSDGMFPVWAKLAPTNKYLEVAESFNGSVWIDDAHPAGILGNSGKGSFEYLQLKSDRLYMGATLAKAFGAYGGIIPGDSRFINEIKRGSVLTGSSAPMAAAVAASIEGINIVKNNPGLREKLKSNALYLKQGICSLGIAVDMNDFPIVAFTLGNSDNMKKVHKKLMNKGIYIQYMNYLGAGNNGVLRIVISSEHTKEHVDLLVQGLKEII